MTRVAPGKRPLTRKENHLTRCNPGGHPIRTLDAALERFWSHVAIRDEDDCWPWLCNPGSRGYGKIRFDLVPEWEGKDRSNLAVAFFTKHGYWPKSASPVCGYKLCCNPRHVVDGFDIPSLTRRGSRHGRPFYHGEKVWSAKLTEEKVREARRLRRDTSLSLREIAAAVDAPYSAVQKAISGQSWQYVS
jgi:hypothetical protein